MNIQAIILAAGKGRRMRSQTPKVLHRLGDKTLLEHVLTTAAKITKKRCVIYRDEAVREKMDDATLRWVLQKNPNGTGDAVAQALPIIDENALCLILYGDVPLVQSSTLFALIEAAAPSGFALVSSIVENPTGYGRIIRDQNGKIVRIVEDKDCNDEERKIREINTGIIAIEKKWLTAFLKMLKPDNAQNELYLTDIVKIAADKKISIHGISADADEMMGVNDVCELAKLERIRQHKMAEKWLRQGLKIADPARFDVRGKIAFGENCRVDVNVIFAGETVLGNNISIGENCRVENTKIGDGTKILPNSIIVGATIGKHATVGPFARIRPGSEIGENATVGNFVEIKKSKIGAGSKINHLSYIGDATIGQNVNVGAGVITCNYDGRKKHQTIIKDGAFIGSGSELVAPVEIGKNAKIGAGSVITENVPDGSLALSRARQIIKK